MSIQINGLTLKVTPAGTDEIEIQETGGGVSRKATLSSLFSGITSGIGIGTASPDGTLHVHTASAGAVVADTNKDDLVVESSSNSGISVLTPDTSIGGIIFGSPSNKSGSLLDWKFSTKEFRIATNTASGFIDISTAVFVNALRIDANQNVLIGGTASPAGATKALALFNGTVPTGNIVNGVILYSEDVTASAELKVRDEAGNITTLSPHSFPLISEGPSEHLAWSFYSERDGMAINVDMLKAIRAIEKLSGEELAHVAKIIH